VLSAAVALLSAAVVTAAVVAAATALEATAAAALEPVAMSGGAVPPASLVRFLRLSTQAILLCFSQLRLRAFGLRLALCLAAGRWLHSALSEVEFGGQLEKSKHSAPPRVTRTILHQQRAATHAR
jgi:hypothetical protein